MRMPVHWRIGLKLYSTDFDIIADARKLQNGFFDFVELYVVPDSYETTINAWKDFDIPFIIHMPHSLHGVNLAQAENGKPTSFILRKRKNFLMSLVQELLLFMEAITGILMRQYASWRYLKTDGLRLKTNLKWGSEEMYVRDGLLKNFVMP